MAMDAAHREAIRRYRDQWRAVEQIQHEEWRAKTAAQRWLDLELLVRSFGDFKKPWRRTLLESEEEAQVRARWVKLKEPAR